MKSDIRLFIGGKEIEFNADPKILFNYKVTEITNPTVVKNSYTKSIEVEGTPRNNDVFQNIWNLERIQWAGIDFNPIKKADFVLYVDGNIYERGYAKLDGIKNKNNKCTYSITLFGGLGEFFYNLSFKDSEGNDKKTLADLRYNRREPYGDGTGIYQDADPDLNFRINKEAIWDAMEQITGDPDAVYDDSEVDRPNNYLWNDRWEVINFAPAYNGIPDDFDANKVLVNGNYMPADILLAKTDGGVTYKAYNNYVLGELAEGDLTEWTSYDLRSYLMRPVISLHRVIDACCNPLNNGGYEIVYDPEFFDYANPYYRDSYITLPMLRTLTEGGQTETVTEAELTFRNGAQAGESWQMEHWNVDYEQPTTISVINNVNVGIILDLVIPTNLSNDRLYLYKEYNATVSKKGDTERVESYTSLSQVSVQLVAYDNLNNIVATSNVYYILDEKAGGNVDFGFYSGWYQSNVPVPDVTTVYGQFRKVSANTYRFVDSDGNAKVLGFRFKTDDVQFSRLELKVLPNSYDTIYYRYPYKWWKSKEYNGTHKMEYNLKPLELYRVYDDTFNGDLTVDNALARGAYEADVHMEIVDFQIITKDYEGLFSDTLIRKEALLATESTPADYLLSFAKIFGLHFYRDPNEEATDPIAAPKGRIHIMTRDTFYTGEIEDLNDYIDMNKGIDIKPVTMDSKYINFNIEQIESEANEEYKGKFGGVDYGYKKINTGYNFNADNKAILDNIVFKGGIEALETDKYYQLPRRGMPAYTRNGFKYNLYDIDNAVAGEDLNTLELQVETKLIERRPINPNGWEDTDLFKKVQLHSEDNGSIDGENVLLFYTGNTVYTGDSDDWNALKYWITDDVPEMALINDGTPCWMLNFNEFDLNGNRVAYAQTTLPVFERNMVYGPTKTIINSWDMGNPQMTFVREMYVGPKGDIYSKCWDKYISDLYNQDNRILTAYCWLKTRPNAEMLRKFYWFRNSLWRINSISDWNVNSFEPTKIEFVKVIDTANYELEPIRHTAVRSFTISNLVDVSEDYTTSENERYYETGSGAYGAVMMIEVGQAGSWWLGGDDHTFSISYADGRTTEYYEIVDWITPNTVRGTGDGMVTFNITENTEDVDRTFSISVMYEDDSYKHIYIIQQAPPQPTLTITPNSVTGPAEGGTVTAQVKYENRNGDTLTSDQNEGDEYQYFNWSLGPWVNDIARLTITFDENTSTEAKTGAYLQFTGMNQDVSASITINQAGAEASGDGNYEFELSSYSLKFQANGGTQQVNVINDTTERWEVISSPSWATVVSDDLYMTIAVASYGGHVNRTGEILIRAYAEDNSTIDRTISVLQYGLVGTVYLNNSPDTIYLNLEAAAGSRSADVTVTMNNIVSWYYNLTNSDFSMQVADDGSSFFVFADVTNTTEQIKTGTAIGHFTDTNGNVITRRIEISQEA